MNDKALNIFIELFDILLNKYKTERWRTMFNNDIREYSEVEYAFEKEIKSIRDKRNRHIKLLR